MPVHLLRFANAADAAPLGLPPWLASSGSAAWRHPLPTLIVAPSAAALTLAKRLALEMPERGTLQVYFCTPADLDRRLAQAEPGSPPRLARPDLELLLASALTATVSDDPAVAAFLGDPAPLAAWVDEAAAAGCDVAELALPPAVEQAVRSALNMAHASGVSLKNVAPDSRSSPCRLFQNLFVFGFHAAHLPLWPVLRAAVASSHAATVCLAEPRSAGESLDQLWINLWEEYFGDAVPAEVVSPDRPLSPLAEQMETPEPAEHGPLPADAPLVLRVGTTTLGEARAVVAQTLSWLEAGAERLGILVPARGPLSREVSRLLDAAGVAHGDGLGHWAPDLPPAWRLWLRFQSGQQSPDLVALAETLHPPGVTVNDLLDCLERARRTLPVPDLARLRTALPTDHHRLQAVTDWLTRLVLLPERAPVADLLTASLAAFETFGWTTLAADIRRAAAPVALHLTGEIPRAAWLRWLDIVVPSFRKQRSAAGSHPFARVHLLRYDEAQGLPWSHLILTSLNEGVWPASLPPAALRPPSLIQSINRSAHTTGRHGAGQVILREGRGHLFTEGERRFLARRQLADLLDAADTAVCATLHRHDDTPAAATLHAGSYFFQLHHAATGSVPDDASLDELVRRTETWLAPSPWHAPAAPTIPRPEVRTAFDARRDSDAPFGPYEFAFASTPPALKGPAADTWQKMLRTPALFWLEHYAGARPRRDPTDDPSSQWRGICAHQWLSEVVRQALGLDGPGWRPITTEAPEFSPRLKSATAAYYSAMEKRFAASGLTPPLGWESLHREAAHVAGQMAGFLPGLLQTHRPTHAVTEWTLPPGLTFRGTSGEPLTLAGRADLALCRVSPPEGEPPAGHVCLIDFKTGGSATFRLDKAEGVQLAIYGLAAEAQGAESVALHLLKSDGLEPETAVSLDALHQYDALWDTLARVESTGRCGMRETLRDAYARGVELPLATLAVDKDILDEKWALTHPALAPPSP